MIQALKAHTVQSDERWEGHPSIPERVFGPIEYLPIPSRKVTRSQDAGRSLCTAKIGNFEATKSWHGQPDPKAMEESLSARFATWFDFTFTDSNPRWKQKAIQASREAASVVLMKAQHCKDWPTEMSDAYQPKANLSRETTWLEYQPKTEDIHLITEFE